MQSPTSLSRQNTEVDREEVEERLTTVEALGLSSRAEEHFHNKFISSSQ